MDHAVKHKQMENNIKIRSVVSADADQLIKLYEEVWSNVPYNKKAKTYFVLNESDGCNFCAEKDGEIVSSRLSYYMHFFFGHNQIKCIQLCDSCTRSDCRGKGIFGKLDKILLAKFFESDNNGLIWNISADASRRVHEKYGWKYIKSLATMLMICRPFNIFSKVGLNFSKLLGVVEWDNSNDCKPLDYKHLIAREKLMQIKNLLHVNYDIKTITWRMKTYSGIKSYNSTEGTIYFKIGHKDSLTFILIGEIFLSDYNFMLFKQLLKKFIKKYNPDIIKLAISNGHPLVSFYKRFGFFYNPRNKYLNHGVRVASDAMQEICYNPNNWAISMLDIDTF